MTLAMPDARTVPGLLDEMARRYPAREAVVGPAERLSYAALRSRSRALAKGLYALGVGRGDKVAIWMGNRPEWLVANFAVALLGATTVALNTWATERELDYQLGHSDTSVLIMVDRFLKANYVAMVRAIAAGLPSLRRVIVLGEQSPAGMVPFTSLFEIGATVADATIDAAQARVAKEDIVYILYTSGSTATPKGVQLQHFALIENMWHIGERQHLTPDDRLWLAVSLFWGLGCENALFALMTHGGTVVLQEHFDAAAALELIEVERCTVLYATPNMVLAMTEHPDRPTRDLSSLRTGVTIGSPAQIARAAELGAGEICNVYGLTETYGNCAVADGHDPLTLRLQSVGTPLPGVEIVIADPTSHAPLAAGEVGEIKVRGYVTPGYYKDAERNAAAFDDEGYFLTGDLGLLDPQGRLYFKGRLKEMVKTGGINVAPAEVEEILMAHDAVEQAFVIGLPDRQRDAILAAVIVPPTAGGVDGETLRAHCRAALAAYKVPRRFHFVSADELPLTTTGKVQKNRLAAFFAAAP